GHSQGPARNTAKEGLPREESARRIAPGPKPPRSAGRRGHGRGFGPGVRPPAEQVPPGGKELTCPQYAWRRGKEKLRICHSSLQVLIAVTQRYVLRPRSDKHPPRSP